MQVQNGDRSALVKSASWKQLRAVSQITVGASYGRPAACTLSVPCPSVDNMEEPGKEGVTEAFVITAMILSSVAFALRSNASTASSTPRRDRGPRGRRSYTGCTETVEANFLLPHPLVLR